MDPKIEAQSSTEKEKTVDTAWLFDVDGVITHPQQKRVTEPQILDEIVKRLKTGESVALVTGRSLSFLRDRVVNPLAKRIDDKQILSNFLAIGEKGGNWLTFDESGSATEHIDESLSVPQSLQVEARQLVADRFSKTMFFDESKRTMISIEMKDGIPLKDFWPRQQELVPILNQLLAKHNLADQLKVDPTSIATDVESKNVGKTLGARKALDWLKERKIKPKRVVAVGDSQSDLEMAEEIYTNNLPVEFVFVGEPERLQAKNLPFPTVSTTTRFEKGTLEYLQSSK